MKWDLESKLLFALYYCSFSLMPMALIGYENDCDLSNQFWNQTIKLFYICIQYHPSIECSTQQAIEIGRICLKGTW